MFRLIVTNDEEVVKFARERGAGVFIAEKLPEGLELAEGKEKETETEDEVSKVYFLLRELDIRPNIKGYQYLKFVMEQCRKDSGYHAKSITKEIYPDCAQRFATTPSRVERAIRHAIEVAWDRGNPDVLSDFFGYTILGSKGKPTNSEFIALIADKIRLEMKVS